MDYRSKQIQQRIHRLDYLININNAIVKNNQYTRSIQHQTLNPYSHLIYDNNDIDTIHYRIDYTKPIQQTIDSYRKQNIQKMYELVKQTIDQQNEFQRELKDIKKQLSNQKTNYYSIINRSKLNDNTQINYTQRKIQTISPAELLNSNYEQKNKVHEKIPETSPFKLLNTNNLDRDKTLFANRTLDVSNFGENKFQQKQPPKARKKLQQKKKKLNKQKQNETFGVFGKNKQENLDTLVKDYEKAKFQFQNTLAKLIKSQKQAKYLNPYHQLSERNKKIKSIQRQNRSLRDNYIENPLQFIKEYKKNKANSVKSRKSKKPIMHLTISNDVKSFISKKVQKRIIQSEQNFKDSIFKNVKHEHTHIMKTYDLQNKLRQEILKRIHELQDIKIFK